MIWSAHDTRYQLELWDVAGSLRKTLYRPQPSTVRNQMRLKLSLLASSLAFATAGFIDSAEAHMRTTVAVGENTWMLSSAGGPLASLDSSEPDGPCTFCEGYTVLEVQDTVMKYLAAFANSAARNEVERAGYRVALAGEIIGAALATHGFAVRADSRMPLSLPFAVGKLALELPVSDWRSDVGRAEDGIPRCAKCIAVVTPAMGTELWLAVYSNTEEECSYPGQCYVCVEDECWVADDVNILESEWDAWAWIGMESGCPECQPEEEFAQLLTELSLASVPIMARLIKEADGRVWLNEARSAIQATGCGSRVGFHHPLTDEVQVRLAAELDRLAVPVPLAPKR
jgi:hypothetical protein